MIKAFIMYYLPRSHPRHIQGFFPYFDLLHADDPAFLINSYLMSLRMAGAMCLPDTGGFEKQRPRLDKAQGDRCHETNNLLYKNLSSV